MLEEIKNLLPTWDRWMVYAFVLFVLLAGLIFLIRIIGEAIQKSYKAKYDFTAKYELAFTKYAVISLVIAVGLIANTVATEFIYENPTMFFFRLFLTVSLALILGSTLVKFIDYNYPSKLEKKLKRYRYTPRVSPKSGKKMRLLTEEEEDVHLDEGMIAEEDVFSIDYDVWIDEESGYTQIEKYAGHMHADECPSCHYQTLKVEREEIVESPTVDKEGELIKHYKCALCNHRERKSFKIAKIEHAPGDPGKKQPEATTK